MQIDLPADISSGGTSSDRKVRPKGHPAARVYAEAEATSKETVHSETMGDGDLRLDEQPLVSDLSAEEGNADTDARRGMPGAPPSQVQQGSHHNVNLPKGGNSRTHLDWWLVFANHNR